MKYTSLGLPSSANNILGSAKPANSCRSLLLAAVLRFLRYGAQLAIDMTRAGYNDEKVVELFCCDPELVELFEIIE